MVARFLFSLPQQLPCHMIITAAGVCLHVQGYRGTLPVHHRCRSIVRGRGAFRASQSQRAVYTQTQHELCPHSHMMTCHGTQARVSTASIPLSLSHSLTLARSLFLSHSLTLSLSRSRARCPSLSLSHSLARSLSPSFPFHLQIQFRKTPTHQRAVTTSAHRV